MVKEKKIDLGAGREAVLKAELEQRPPLEPVVAVVRIAAPWWPGGARRRIIQFLDGLVAAFRIRAQNESDLTIIEAGGRVVVRRWLENGRYEVRLEREGRARGNLHCDHRELANLHALGVLAGAKVIRPKPPKPKNADDKG